MGEQLHVNPMSAWQNGDIPVNTTMITNKMQFKQICIYIQVKI